MGTKEFNLLDKFIARIRLGKVITHVKKGDRVLDFGCGHQAYLLNHLQDRISEGTGVDSDSESYEIAPHIRVVNCHFKTKLPFEEKSFDKITLLAVLEHLDPVTASNLFREFSRVLAPGGKVILTTPTPFGKVILEFLAFRLGIISAKEVADHKKYYGRRDLERFSKEQNYIIDEYKTFQLGGNSICVMKKAKQ